MRLYTQSDINHALQIALNALRVGRNPTDTAGMDSDDEAWYESKQEAGDDMDTLILHLYQQLKAQKKKGSKKKKRTKKRTKKRSKKQSKKAGTGISSPQKSIKKKSPSHKKPKMISSKKGDGVAIQDKEPQKHGVPREDPTGIPEHWK
jgi:hypothetical protein